MSHPTSIDGASRALKAWLEARLSHLPAIGVRSVAIDLRPPREVRASGGDAALSLWLYRVLPSPAQAARSPMHISTGLPARAGLTVDLFYLATPRGPFPEVEQALLEVVLQAIHTEPVVGGAAGEPALRLALEPLTLDDLAELWRALQEPYQLAVAFRATGLELQP